MHLYVPPACVEAVKRICDEYQIVVAELWTYTTSFDQVRFTLVNKSPDAPTVKIPVRAEPAMPKPAVKAKIAKPAAAPRQAQGGTKAKPAKAKSKPKAAQKAKAKPKARPAAKKASKPKVKIKKR